MKRLLDILFHRRNLFIMLFILIFGYGIYSYIVIPKQEMPKIDTPYMAISMIVPGSSATYIEDNVVEDIENVVLTYSDVTEVRSYVYDNYALSYVLFSYSTQDPDQLAVDIFTKVNDLSLDDAVTELSYNSNFDDPHIIFSVYSDTLSITELNNYAEEYKNQLITIDEIQTVTIDSAFQEEVVITLDTTLLELYGLSMTDIYQIIYANSLNIPLGGINTVYGTISISGYREFNSLDDLENLIIIPTIPGVTPTIYLEDLATISIQDTSMQYYEFNQEQAVFLSVYFEDDIDFTILGDEVLELKEDFLIDANNSELSIDEMLFLPDYVNQQINNVFYSLLIAIGVVTVIVLIGIGFRNSLLVVLTIPVIIFGTVGILYISGFELHKLTIVGLIVAIGIMVDNSIVITEGIKHNIDRGMKKVEGAKQAIQDNFAPILSSTLTTIAAFIVLVLLPGFLGEVVSSMPLTVIIAISLSYIVSMILSPILAVLFLKPSKKSQKVDLNTIHHKRIRTMIRNTIKFPIAWLLLAIVSLGLITYLTFTNQPLDLYPNDERSVIYIDFENDVLGDIESTRTLRDDITDVFIDNPHVVNVSSSIGGSLPHFHFSAELINALPQFGRIYINLDYTEQELLDYVVELESQFESFDTAKITVNIMELSPPIAPVRVTISGDDIDTVTTISTLLFDEIIELDSVKSDNVIQNISSTKFVIDYDYEQISASYLSKAQIDGFIATELNGLDLHIFDYNSETINVHLESTVTSVEDILGSSIYSEQLDAYVPLSSLIQINSETDYSVINRFNSKNVAYIDLYFANDSSLAIMENDVRELISHHDTSQVTVTYGGENEMFEEISTDLIRAALIAILLIYIIMYIQFNNFIKPLIVFLTIPLSFVGSFLFLWIFDSPITATSLVGMVSLLGVTVNNGILLVEYISRHHKQYGDVEEACVEAVLLRFRPIMLTSFTTILGLIPLLITGGNFFQPMALTFMGGMVTSTLITIFLIPSVYKLIYSTQNKRA